MGSVPKAEDERFVPGHAIDGLLFVCCGRAAATAPATGKAAIRAGADGARKAAAAVGRVAESVGSTTARAAVKSTGRVAKAAAKAAAKVVKKEAGEAVAEVETLPCPCFPEATLVLTPYGALQISQVELGQRVLPEFEECKASIGDDLVKVELDTTIWGPDGGTIELLRPRAWVVSLASKPGSLAYVNLPEVGARGWAAVTSISTAGPVQDGPGCVVTALFRHRADDLVQLSLSSGEQIEATSKHLLYSEARGWTAAGGLRPGEELRTQTGTAAVTSVTWLQEGRREVFNLEVSGGHQYLVGESGLLAHNECACTKSAGAAAKAAGEAGSGTATATGREIKEAEQALKRNQDFRRWFHREYKADQVASKGGRSNPDLSPEQVNDAYREWLDSGKPKVK